MTAQFAALVFLFLCSIVHAELTFRSKAAHVEAKVDSETVEAFYHFENSGETNEVITEVKSICPLCLSAGVKGGTRTEKGIVFKSGEKGVIKAVFKVGAAAGQVDKMVEIYKLGDAEDKPSIKLTCNIKVPVVVTLEPRTLSWKEGEEFVAKKVVIDVADGHEMLVKEPSLKSGDFEIEFKVLQKGKKYELTAKPKAGSKVQIVGCYFNTDSTNPRYRRLRAYLKVSR